MEGFPSAINKKAEQELTKLMILTFKKNAAISICHLVRPDLIEGSYTAGISHLVR
jgi:hypothetical protein